MTMGEQHQMIKEVERINKLFSLHMDKQALSLAKAFIANYKPLGYTLRLDTESRLALLERLVNHQQK